MGTCKYCGMPVGVFRSKHKECVREHDAGIQEITSAIREALSSSDAASSLLLRVKEIAARTHVQDGEEQRLRLEGWASAVEKYLDDGVLDEEEEKRVLELQQHLALSQDDIDKTEAFTKAVKAAIIRDILAGTIPQRLKIDGIVPVNLQKTEQVVWVFKNVDYLEDKMHRQFVGGSQGMSVRVMRGVYYRSSAFRGHAVERTERLHVDTGLLIITNQNIYFAGPAKSIRLPYRKIVSFQPFSDGVGVVRDATSAKPQIFVTGDGWFTYNLVTNLAQL